MHLLYCCCMAVTLCPLVILSTPCMCITVLRESTHWSCHLIRTKSDFTKRLHHLGGLLGSRHWDASHLGECLHSFSQQLAHCASALKQITYCLVFARGSWQTRADRSEVWTSCVKPKIWGDRQIIGTTHNVKQKAQNRFVALKGIVVALSLATNKALVTDGFDPRIFREVAADLTTELQHLSRILFCTSSDFLRIRLISHTPVWAG